MGRQVWSTSRRLSNGAETQLAVFLFGESFAGTVSFDVCQVDMILSGFQFWVRHREVVFPAGGAHNFLEVKYGAKALMPCRSLFYYSPERL